MKEVKPIVSVPPGLNEFENLVNYERSQTNQRIFIAVSWFENLVNYERSQTIHVTAIICEQFENLVNYERSQT